MHTVHPPNIAIDFYSASIGEWSIVVSVSVCVCVRACGRAGGRVCVCVFFSVRNHIFGTTRLIFTNFFVHATYGRGSVLISLPSLLLHVN